MPNNAINEITLYSLKYDCTRLWRNQSNISVCILFMPQLVSMCWNSLKYDYTRRRRIQSNTSVCILMQQ